MRVIFMGTPDFAVASLEALLREHEVLAVITQPDKPKGRGKKLAFSPVKEYALAHGLAVLQPERVKAPEFVEELRKYNAELIAVTAFGQILPEEILNMPEYGCINVHGSLLPKYRGAAPMQRAIIDGETVTGITTMFMAKGMDTGDMLLKTEVEITPEDNFETLHDKMAAAGASLLLETIAGLESGMIQRIPQKEEDATYAPMIDKETGHISWEKGGQEIINLMRGLTPGPGAYTLYEGEPLKLFRAEAENGAFPDAEFGEIVEVTKQAFAVKCGDGVLWVRELQARGGKRMSADAYLRGHEMKEGVLLT
ncbi:MAG: methionyl-tRNA formyltransferase [Anaerotignum sp.]|jgi:methionyl-tRNA formyltransferase|nr:methionyl-tRNA formyltransferase [Anaerotignum sp.]MCI8868510.1 methionyl-tRNA formyltransferase [Anaerotignum sp.]